MDQAPSVPICKMEYALPSFLKVAVICLVAAPALMGAHMGVQQLKGNFHEVLPGELYRSAQPDGADVIRYAGRYGIRTIINLRDEERGDWYDEERNAALMAGIKLIDVPMSSTRVLSVEESGELARIMREAEGPILIHCEHGANRTGLAAAIYMAAVANRSEFLSELQLSPWYGHVPIKGIGRYEMYESWDRYEETLGF